MSGSGVHHWVSLEPHDTVHIRDGRAFNAGTDSTAESVLPTPATTGGAIGAAHGGRLKSMRGPVIGYRKRPADGYVTYFPAPGDLAIRDEHPASATPVYRLAPGPLDAVTDLGGCLGLVARDSAIPVRALDAYLPSALITEYLAAEISYHPPTRDWAGWRVAQLGHLSGYRRLDDLLAPERRVGLALERSRRTAAEGFLYSASHRRPHQGVSFLVDCEFDVGHGDIPRLAETTRLGGEQRLATTRFVDDGLVSWPQPPTDYPGGRVLLYVATPGVWGGHRPPLPSDAELVTWAVGAPQPIRTATPASGLLGSRRLLWAVPAGSVYFIQFPDEHQATEWAAQSHAKALGPAVDADLQTAGFGVVLTGRWHPCAT